MKTGEMKYFRKSCLSLFTLTALISPFFLPYALAQPPKSEESDPVTLATQAREELWSDFEAYQNATRHYEECSAKNKLGPCTRPALPRLIVQPPAIFSSEDPRVRESIHYIRIEFIEKIGVELQSWRGRQEREMTQASTKETQALVKTVQALERGIKSISTSERYPMFAADQEVSSAAWRNNSHAEELDEGINALGHFFFLESRLKRNEIPTEWELDPLHRRNWTRPALTQQGWCAEQRGGAIVDPTQYLQEAERILAGLEDPSSPFDGEAPHVPKRRSITPAEAIITINAFYSDLLKQAKPIISPADVEDLLAFATVVREQSSKYEEEMRERASIFQAKFHQETERQISLERFCLSLTHAISEAKSRILAYPDGAKYILPHSQASSTKAR